MIMRITENIVLFLVLMKFIKSLMQLLLQFSEKIVSWTSEIRVVSFPKNFGKRIVHFSLCYSNFWLMRVIFIVVIVGGSRRMMGRTKCFKGDNGIEWIDFKEFFRYHLLIFNNFWIKQPTKSYINCISYHLYFPKNLSKPLKCCLSVSFLP